MKLVYFDICSIPLFVLIIGICFARRMTMSRAERLFMLVNFLSLICAVLDILMEFVVNPVPISAQAVAAGTAISFTYKLLHNATLVLYLLFIFYITRTAHFMHRVWVRIMLWLPFAVLTALLIQNFFTHNVFSVTMQEGYSRGPLLLVIYAVVFMYGIGEIAYCVYCRRYLDTGKWVALLSVYALIFAAVAVEFLYPQLLLEMFASAIGILLVLNLVMRPEETMDGYVAIRTRRAYENDLRNVILSGDAVQVVVIRMANANEIRSYLGEKRYFTYVNMIVDELRQLKNRLHLSGEMYLERPGIIFLILDDADYDISVAADEFNEKINSRIGEFQEIGVRFEPRVCTIRIPEDLNDYNEILEIGHKFQLLGTADQILYNAADLRMHRDFNSIVHMDEILGRAITEDSLKVLYQPIYNLREQQFESAEALSRLIDREYGMISPALFIPAAEANGLILGLGEKILESVFRFISEHDLDELGLSYIEINLSIAQMLQPRLPQILEELQRRYGVNPDQINLEITESLFENISSVIVDNVQALRNAGYSFSLDDYGTGYSSIQRMNKFPLSIVKIDKSMADDMFTDAGNVIMLNTIRMMHGIHKKLVVEGIETEEAMRALKKMSCDCIQGYYYSRPLSEEDLVEFLRGNNRPRRIS